MHHLVPEKQGSTQCDRVFFPSFPVFFSLSSPEAKPYNSVIAFIVWLLASRRGNKNRLRLARILVNFVVVNASRLEHSRVQLGDCVFFLLLFLAWVVFAVAFRWCSDSMKVPVDRPNSVPRVTDCAGVEGVCGGNENQGGGPGLCGAWFSSQHPSFSSPTNPMLSRKIDTSDILSIYGNESRS